MNALHLVRSSRDRRSEPPHRSRRTGRGLLPLPRLLRLGIATRDEDIVELESRLRLLDGKAHEGGHGPLLAVGEADAGEVVRVGAGLGFGGVEGDESMGDGGERAV